MNKWLSHYLTYKTKNHSHSIDAYFHNGAGTLSLSLLPIPETNAFIMHDKIQITVKLPYLQDQQLLMPHWRSFLR